MDQEAEALKHELELANSEVDVLVEMAKKLNDETQLEREVKVMVLDTRGLTPEVLEVYSEVMEEENGSTLARVELDSNASASIKLPQELMGYTLAVLGGTKNKYEVDKVEVEHHGALLPDDMLKISISSSDLGKFNKEEGAWVFQDTGETVGVKVCVLVRLAHSVEMEQRSKMLGADFDVALSRQSKAKAALHSHMDGKLSSQVVTKRQERTNGASGAVKPGFLNTRAKALGTHDRVWKLVSGLGVGIGQMVWHFRNHLLFTTGVTLMAWKGDMLAV
eukprot:238149_1